MMVLGREQVVVLEKDEKRVTLPKNGFTRGATSEVTDASGDDGLNATREGGGGIKKKETVRWEVAMRSQSTPSYKNSLQADLGAGLPMPWRATSNKLPSCSCLFGPRRILYNWSQAACATEGAQRGRQEEGRRLCNKDGKETRRHRRVPIQFRSQLVRDTEAIR